MAAEITATSSDCPVLKFAPGSAIGKTSTIIASGNRAIRYCLMPNRFIYWVANLRPPSSRETDQTAGDDHNNGVEGIRIKVGAASPVAIKAEIKLTSRITTDRLKIREP